MGFAAMLADEHTLIFLFVNHLLFRQTFFNLAFVHIFIISNFIGVRFGLTNINASTAASPVR
jgi:hypothetical protein